MYVCIYIYIYSYSLSSVSRAVQFCFLGTAQGVLLSAARPQANAWWAMVLRVFRATWAEKTCKNVDPNAQSYNY